jgi:hypothetical protein
MIVVINNHAGSNAPLIARLIAEKFLVMETQSSIN